MFPVPAAVALLDLGDITKPAFDADGFFDTATWGDLGGQVWVARFYQPGTLDPTTGRVTNWFAARTFEQQRSTDDRQRMRGDGSTTAPLGQVRSEFYFMTTNAYESTSRTLRTYAGGGNREQMLEAGNAPGCGPDNLLSCLRSGCSSVSTQTVDNFGACSNTAAFSYSGGVMTQDASTTTCASLPAVCAPSVAQPYSSTTTFNFTCGGVAATPISVGLTTDSSGLASYFKSVDSYGANAGASYVDPTKLTASGNQNRFYGLWAYGKDAKKMFDDIDPVKALAAAKAFDANRFTDVAYTGTCSGPTGSTCSLVDTTTAVVTYDTSGATAAVSTACGGGITKCSATNSDAGWFYQYGVICPISTCQPAPPWTDEKTSAGANLVMGCTAWSGFRPIGSTTTVNGPCDIKIGTPTSYSYLADFVSGTPSRACGWTDNGIIRRSAQRTTWSPPSAPTVRVTVNDKGQVNYSTLQLDPGAPPGQKTIGTRSDVAEPVYWLEVPRSLHACRHADGTACK
jgi:type IV pilus assembly protein PilY1